MTVSGDSFPIKVIYAGPHAALQLPAGRPTFYVRASDVSKAEALVVYQFKAKKDRRDLETRQTSAERTGGGEPRTKSYGMQMGVKRVAAEVYSVIPDGDLSAGEYLLTADNGETGYDFGVQ
jgi:hypothetical protein